MVVLVFQAELPLLDSFEKVRVITVVNQSFFIYSTSYTDNQFLIKTLSPP